MDRQAVVMLPDSGRRLSVSRVQVVDPRRFCELSEQTVIAWHRNGGLALVHFHLASLERFADLLARQGRREGGSSARGPGDKGPQILQ